MWTRSVRSVTSVVATLVAAFVLLTAGVAHAQNLSINNVTQAETNGATTFTFQVTLDAPAGPGGVTFDIATANDTATTVNNDYAQLTLNGQSISAGNVLYSFDVTVNGDVTPEADETFFVNVTNVTNATVADGQGVGTISNDDPTPIHDIQGPGATSPIDGSVVITRGIVTGVKSDGFFMQEGDATVDADPATSEGIFVFTSTPPPVAAAFSALVEVRATVDELIPSSDPQAPSYTRLISPTSIVQILPPGQTLPTAIALTSSFPSPAGPFDQLERVEGMRVSAASVTVTGPTGGNVDEVNATATSHGLFHGVITGVPRPFREAGIQAPDLPPSGTIPPIPRWDANPERLGIDSDGIDAQPIIDVKSGDIVTAIAGPLEYALRAYTIVPDGVSTPAVTTGTLPTTVTSAAGNEVTVASINLRRFFDTVDEPTYAEPVLTPAAYDTRLDKASLAIRTHLLSPDIIGIQEAENLGVLNDLAARILADGGPDYDAYLQEGNDGVNGLDVGFLVKTNAVIGGAPRVSVISVTQIGAADLLVHPDTSTSLLNDRPPLVLQATVNRTSTVSFPIVVIVTDLLGLTGIDDVGAGSNGYPTVGDGVRHKRLEQAAFLANYVQTRQTMDPTEQLAVIGGFNAFEVNDGYVDVMNTVAGTPPPDNQTVVPSDGVDLVDPDLLNLVSTPPAAQRYSDVFLGNARNVDHVLVGPTLVDATITRRIEHARIGADYPEVEMNNGATALRFSDRDPVVAYFATDAFEIADLLITNIDQTDPVTAGQNLAYLITVTNNGPDIAGTVSWSDTLPSGTTFVSLTSIPGWSCITPAVGAAGTISCSRGSMTAGGSQFTLTVAVSAAVAPGTVLSNTATVTSLSADPAPGNESATATTTVNGPTPVNAPPTITAIANQSGNANATIGPLPFTVDDTDNPVAGLTLSGTSSNQALVTNAGITFGGSGANRTVTITPLADEGGQTTITVTVSDGAATASTSFVLTIAPPTPTPTPLTYFLAEGATGSFFDEDLVIANPNGTAAPVTITFFREGMTSVTETRTVAARSGITLRVDSLTGLEAAAASVQVTSEDGLPLAVERTQFWGEGSYGGHTESALPAPATRWHFAEGSQGYFDTFVLVANPQPQPVDVTLTFLREDDTSVTTTVQVPPFERETISAATIPDLVNRSFAIIVDAPQPVVAERAMYFGTTATRPWSGGGATAGATTPSSSWYFAEGATGTFFDTFILLMNPDEENDANVTLRYLLDSGEAIDVPKTIPARGRITVNIEAESDTRLHAASMSTRITSDRPIVAERSVYWPTDEGAQPWGESHISQGVTAAASRWALAEGRTGGPLNFHTYVLLGNPGTQSAEVTVEFLPTTGTPIAKTYVVPALSRYTIDVTSEAPEIQDLSFITLITTPADRPIVVERSLYWDGAGLTWSGGSNAVGTRLPE
jgi:uncharacterized protein